MLRWRDLILRFGICWEIVRCEGIGVEEGKYLRRSAAWRALTRPIAAIMGSLLRPVVRRRRRSWTSFWVAIVYKLKGT